MNIKTVLFDLDGTLIDTNELINESFRHTFNKYKFEFTDSEIRNFNGPPLRDTFNQLNQDLAEEMIQTRSEEHTSELQSRGHLVCRLLLEKKKKINKSNNNN